MNVPTGLRYTRSDEWVRLNGDIVTIGITDYAQHELGELVYVELPEVGHRLVVDASFGVVESVKAVAELLSPVAGEVIEVNEPLGEDPAVINGSPFGDGWLIRAKISNPEILNSLMSPADYEKYRG